MSSSRLILPSVQRVVNSGHVHRSSGWVRKGTEALYNKDWTTPSIVHSSRTMSSNLDSRSHVGRSKQLCIDNLNPNIKLMEYAVRGPLVIRASEIEKELEKGVKKPFKEVIKANIGDCHAMGQVPITFIRQVSQSCSILHIFKTDLFQTAQVNDGAVTSSVKGFLRMHWIGLWLKFCMSGPLILALVAYPELLDDPRFPTDVKERAKVLLAGCKGGSVGRLPSVDLTGIQTSITLSSSQSSMRGTPQPIRLLKWVPIIYVCYTGSYTDSPGIEVIRRHVAQYIERRDGIPSNWEDILLSAGASEGIKNVLKLLICDIGCKKPGVMVPIPQYPLYSATLAEFNMHQIGYYLDEEKGWSLEISELKRAIKEAKEVSEPRVIVVINPGNPTGQVLNRDNIVEIIKFAHEEDLFIFADEVYQDNVYAKTSKFHSFKRVLTEMGPPYNKIQLASFMSCSKGYMGECGLRGGYSEVINLDPKVKTMLLKSISASLCPTSLGQAVMDTVVNPPQPGEPSYERYKAEKEGVLKSLAERAKMVADSFNSFEGFSCNTVQGAMYAFPQLKIPEKAIKKAESLKQQPDVFYAFQLLEQTGICVVPGSGFGQKPGTYHFRTTILPQPEKLKTMLENFRDFHKKFLEEYK
uniref:alanine transaminase n=1 Tax=Timema douglasi TaxID=61478 RepID=A0A7R8VCZ2_TIMDO|nr:unnamed protein product [Timema douglasi]